MKPCSERTKKRALPKTIKRNLPFDEVEVVGGSHVRHLAGLIKELLDPLIAVSGFCRPGIKLHCIVYIVAQTIILPWNSQDQILNVTHQQRAILDNHSNTPRQPQLQNYSQDFPRIPSYDTFSDAVKQPVVFEGSLQNGSVIGNRDGHRYSQNMLPRSQNSSNSNFKIIHLNAQGAKQTNKMNELSLLCEELKPEVLVITKHGVGFSRKCFFVFKYGITNWQTLITENNLNEAMFVQKQFKTKPTFPNHYAQELLSLGVILKWSH